jgi:hypothetical protein
VKPSKEVVSGDPHGFNSKMAHFVSNMTKLKDLSLSFVFIDENWLNTFATVIARISGTVTSLEIVNHGQLDAGITLFSGMTSISS